MDREYRDLLVSVLRGDTHPTTAIVNRIYEALEVLLLNSQFKDHFASYMYAQREQLEVPEEAPVDGLDATLRMITDVGEGEVMHVYGKTKHCKTVAMFLNWIHASLVKHPHVVIEGQGLLGNQDGIADLMRKYAGIVNDVIADEGVSDYRIMKMGDFMKVWNCANRRDRGVLRRKFTDGMLTVIAKNSKFDLDKLGLWIAEHYGGPPMAFTVDESDVLTAGCLTAKSNLADLSWRAKSFRELIHPPRRRYINRRAIYASGLFPRLSATHVRAYTSVMLVSATPFHNLLTDLWDPSMHTNFLILNRPRTDRHGNAIDCNINLVNHEIVQRRYLTQDEAAVFKSANSYGIDKDGPRGVVLEEFEEFRRDAREGRFAIYTGCKRVNGGTATLASQAEALVKWWNADARGVGGLACYILSPEAGLSRVVRKVSLDANGVTAWTHIAVPRPRGVGGNDEAFRMNALKDNIKATVTKRDAVVVFTCQVGLRCTNYVVPGDRTPHLVFVNFKQPSAAIQMEGRLYGDHLDILRANGFECVRVVTNVEEAVYDQYFMIVRRLIDIMRKEGVVDAEVREMGKRIATLEMQSRRTRLAFDAFVDKFEASDDDEDESDDDASLGSDIPDIDMFVDAIVHKLKMQPCGKLYKKDIDHIGSTLVAASDNRYWDYKDAIMNEVMAGRDIRQFSGGLVYAYPPRLVDAVLDHVRKSDGNVSVRHALERHLPARDRRVLKRSIQIIVRHGVECLKALADKIIEKDGEIGMVVDANDVILAHGHNMFAPILSTSFAIDVMLHIIVKDMKQGVMQIFDKRDLMSIMVRKFHRVHTFIVTTMRTGLRKKGKVEEKAQADGYIRTAVNGIKGKWQITQAGWERGSQLDDNFYAMLRIEAEAEEDD
jgi:hypothetical protein